MLAYVFAAAFGALVVSGVFEAAGLSVSGGMLLGAVLGIVALHFAARHEPGT